MSTAQQLIHPRPQLPPHDQEVLDWTESVFSQITEDQEREKEIRNTLKFIDYIEGKQWGSGRGFSRSRPVINKLRRHYWEAVGLLTDLALEYHVKLYDKLSSYSEFEKLLNELGSAWAQRNKFEAVLRRIVHYGLLHTGPAKLHWKPSLNGGMGDVNLHEIAPWQFGFIGATNDIQEAEVVLYYRPVTIAQLVRDYGAKAEKVQPDADYNAGNTEPLRPKHVSKDAWSRIVPGSALQKLLGQKGMTISKAATYPIALLKELWYKDDHLNEGSETVVVGPQLNGKPRYNWCYYVEPGEKLYPRGRVTLTAGGVPLEDAPNPYWHSMYPFPVLRPYEVPWRFSGMSSVAPWVQMANITNQIYGGVMDMIRSVIEPTLIAPKAAFPQSDWDALDPGAPNMKIKYNNNTPRPPEFAKRAEIPGWVFTYLTEVSREWDMSSGASAISQALGKKQVPGGDALEMIINSRSLPVKVQSHALTGFVEDVGYMGVANMLQFYSVQHRVAILGMRGITHSDYRPIYGEARPEGMKPEEFVKKFAFVIKPGSTLAIEKDQKVQIALALRKMGDISRDGLYRVLDTNFDTKKNLEELIQEAKLKLLLAGAAAQLGGGKGKK